MTEEHQLWYYFCFIAAALLAVIAMHYYLESKLGTRHDKSLVWFSVGMAVWLIVILMELEMLPLKLDLYRLLHQPTPLSDQDVILKNELERKLEFPGTIRRILSIFNSAAMILFLSYFREGWDWLNVKIKKLTATPQLAVLGLSAICFGAAVIDKSTWMRAETAMSILVAALLTTGFTLTFVRRKKMWFMIPLALAGGVLLIFNQLANLAQEQPADQWIAVWPPGDDLIFRRMLALFTLSLNVAALSLTWLGENTAPDQVENRLEFDNEQGQVVVYLSFAKGGKSVSRLRYNDEELTPPKRLFLLLHANATRNGQYIKSNTFNNFSKERDEVLEMLNKKSRPQGIVLTDKDIFAKGIKAGEYRLTFRSENILIDQDTANALNSKKQGV